MALLGVLVGKAEVPKEQAWLEEVVVEEVQSGVKRSLYQVVLVARVGAMAKYFEPLKVYLSREAALN
jgi:hypothetical protein